MSTLSRNLSNLSAYRRKVRVSVPPPSGILEPKRYFNGTRYSRGPPLGDPSNITMMRTTSAS
jgi:hypothetical protein